MSVICILWFRRLVCSWKIRPGNYLTKKQVCWPFVQSCTISSWRLRSTAFATYYRCRWFQEETQRDWSREVCNSHQMIQRAWTLVHHKNFFFPGWPRRLQRATRETSRSSMTWWRSCRCTMSRGRSTGTSSELVFSIHLLATLSDPMWHDVNLLVLNDQL